MPNPALDKSFCRSRREEAQQWMATASIARQGDAATPSPLWGCGRSLGEDEATSGRGEVLVPSSISPPSPLWGEGRGEVLLRSPLSPLPSALSIIHQPLTIIQP